MSSDKQLAKHPPRRNFLLEFWAVLVGGVVGLVPFLSGLAVLLDPLRKGNASEGAELVRVARLDAVPEDGLPHQFPVVKSKKDAWTYSPNERVGAVFLLRHQGSDSVEAFSVVCPHAGCFVGYDADNSVFQCPCHTSSFNLDGTIIVPSPSPRGMDKLEPTKVEDGWIFVPFTNYIPGKHEKIEKQ
jgi:menaquinol-cytochrome c reductase iron-sulfur subunit